MRRKRIPEEIVDVYESKIDGKTFKIGDELVVIRTDHYTDGNRLAVELICADGEDKGMPYCRLTVNIPQAILLPGEIIVKTWEENEESAIAAKASGLFRDTGKRVSTGYVKAEVWEIV